MSSAFSSTFLIRVAVVAAFAVVGVSFLAGSGESAGSRCH